ncbi:helix-turn-helix transcriptional regulator [Blastococcus sp. KM273129]|uniref:helix-turn-helix transcriptional regulator n=1 Tax=Blastococcus sp. KM273129 TaxID=2570315 RepID=UPI001F2E2169|nr:helix-turn-helix transcriptional regulator [Blastococcus sp. KM273129]MCF6735612.1 helix-turn-helix transcriptional regulator [Blastococcus sp. KM273129]
MSAAAARYCRNSVGYLHSLFAGDAPPVAEPIFRAAAIDAAAAAVLAAFPHTATGTSGAAPPGQVMPAAVRRTVEYIDAHAGEPLTLADIVDASGIGPRALQAAFRRYRDTTPTAYLRRVRLDRVHRELQAADLTTDTTVAAVAARWGFAHHGRFAAAYRQAYGRTPQQTLLS